MRTKPIGNDSVKVWQCGGFTNSYEEPHEDQRSQNSDHVEDRKGSGNGGEGRQNGSPNHCEGENAPRPPPVAQPPAWNLAQGITQDKGGKHLAHLDFGSTQGWHHVPGCH